MEGPAFYRLGLLDVLVHEDHRWVLPLVFLAQEEGLLPRPVQLVLFDRHPDAAEPVPIEKRDLTYDSLMTLCADTLSVHDDDWIVAGIRLGLLGDVVIFGVEDRMGELPKQVGSRKILGRYKLPGRMMAAGEDLSREEGSQALWELLGWSLDGFRKDAPPILLDIDLDCFAYAYRERVLPWDEGIFGAEFLEDHSCEATRGWTGLRFFEQLIERAGLITVCREEGCCGGASNADRIFELACRYLLNGLRENETRALRRDK